MYLVRLIYTSRVSETFKSSDIEGILEVARGKNERNNVTGLLCFNRRFFLQCLEGSRAKVNQTYHQILNDPRHEEIVMLNYQEIISREFDRWNMGYMPESSLTYPINLKYSGTPEFDPYEMSGESAHQMMLALRDTVPIQ
ncbi:BLUF domain-containing protein [Pseudomaricurvus alkylphenolicus]|uniref:BLUF domain-containing protein n=1 Tax=Pseudomaricurvus alkylphenolicus TaxID=1306991 RepID=UPI001423376A|nr:BLUF domain-containing protein [Pseudomaricurvus alkylphenolicus]NIB42376.1 BLUF domain-containing protein [Pseudomaricurvus alkylphenolicus]